MVYCGKKGIEGFFFIFILDYILFSCDALLWNKNTQTLVALLYVVVVPYSGIRILRLVALLYVVVYM